jgi:hypothetical protein
MSELSRIQYMEEIQSLADNMVSEEMDNCHGDRSAAEESINDTVLHETIDGHQWVIYNAYNADVMRHSDNTDYYIDNFGGDDAGKILKERGLDGLHNVIAFWCMYADVQNRLSDAFDAYEEAHEVKA